MSDNGTNTAMVRATQTGAMAAPHEARPMGLARRAGRCYPTPDEWRMMSEVCGVIAKGGLGPDDIKGNPEKILTVVLKGYELDLSIMQSLDGIRVIHGRTELSSTLRAALAQTKIPGATIEWLANGDEGVATVRCVRPGRKDVVLSYTIEHAKEAGLLNKETYKRYSADLLRAAALRKACKMQYPEVDFGFEPEEVLTSVVEADVEPSAPHPALDAKRLADIALGKTDLPKLSDDARAPTTTGDAPEDGTLPLPKGSKFSGRLLSSLTDAEFSVVIAGYTKAIEAAQDDAVKAEKKAWLDRVHAWATYRRVGE